MPEEPRESTSSIPAWVHWRIALSVLTPLLASFLQWSLWGYIGPYVWFLFFPTVFLCAVIGGRTGGMIATFLSIVLAWYIFIPPMFSWYGKDSWNGVVSVGMFSIIGYLFSDSQHRLQIAKKRMEAALQETRAANEKINLLYEKTRELDTLKSHFFANVSHELRTPISLILGPVRACLKDSNLSQKSRRALETAERNARFIFRHVSDLLDIAKLEADQMRIRHSNVDAAYLVRVVSSFFETTAADRNITYRVDTPAALPAELDSEKFQRIILNLLSNAFKFTQDGGRITVSLQQQDGDAVLEVIDNGPGVPEHLREEIFEPFRQADSQATRSKGGTGLGLAIVREFTQLHGGCVLAAQAPGTGALFRVTVPLKAMNGAPVADGSQPLAEDFNAQVLDELRMEQPARNPESAPGRADAPLVLIVEDNPDMNAFLAEALSERLRVARAFNGREGLEKVMALRPDLIITDIMMPLMSGDEFLRELKANPETSEIPVVVLSAKADEALRLEMLRVGARDYISKPFTTEEVLIKVESILIERMKTLLDNAMLAAIVESSSDAIIGTSLDGIINSWNTAAQAMLGYAPAEVIGSHINILIPQDARQAEHEIIERAQAGTGTVSAETTRLRKDGSRFDASVSVSPIRNRSGVVVGISRISRDISEQKKAEATLRRALQERTVLLSEVHHRVKNNLQILLSLINLQTESSELRSSDAPLEDMRNRILAMAMVHEHLYRSPDLACMNLGEYLRDLTVKIASTYHDLSGLVSVSVEAEDIPTGVETAIPLGLLVTELVTNAYKHAFKPGVPGLMKLELRSTDAGCVLTVEDDGPGLPQDWNMDNISTLGFGLVNALTGQLHAKMVIPPGPGARFELTFPLC